MKESIRIIAAVVDTKELKMYKEDGSTITIPQGDVRLRKIIDVITPQLVSKKYADVVIEPDDEVNSYANFEQQSSGTVKFFRIAKDKLKKFFNPDPAPVVDTSPVIPLSIGPVPAIASAVPAAPGTPSVAAPAVVEGIHEIVAVLEDHVAAATDTVQVDEKGNVTGFGMPEGGLPVSITRATAEAEEEAALDAAEEVDQEEETFEPVPEQVQTKVEQTMDAVNEIIAHAVPVSSPEFTEQGIKKQGDIADKNGTTNNQREEKDEATHTIIAVVDGKVVPGMERIKTQFNRAAKLGSTIGVERFLQRLSAVIEQRKHSIDDLLKFMERGDLPIADDGSILIYKVLNRRGSEGKFVDCHSGKVEQWTGAYVCMDPSLVDHNRRNECSNGLHVARRGYIRNFGGSACVLAKLAPEDVIAVPEYDANKMRVCGYHILMELTDKQYSLVKSNRPISDDDEGRALLADAIAGRHIHKTHEVRIHGNYGGDVKVKKLERTREAQAPVMTEEPKTSGVALSNPGEELLDDPTAPLDVVKQVEETKVLSRKEQAKVLYDALAGGGQAALDALHAFKKASKTSWEKLGLPDINGPVISLRPDQMPGKKVPVKKGQTKKARKEAAKAKAKQTTPAKAKKAVPVRATAPKPFPKPEGELPGYTAKHVKAGQPVTDLSTGEVIGVTVGGPRDRIHKMLAIGLDSSGVAAAILDIKKKSKKSWTILGVSDEQVAEIMRLAGS